MYNSVKLSSMEVPDTVTVDMQVALFFSRFNQPSLSNEGVDFLVDATLNRTLGFLRAQALCLAWAATATHRSTQSPSTRHPRTAAAACLNYLSQRYVAY